MTLDMAEKFAKQGKSSSELSDLLNYITRPEVDIKEIIEIYDAWADQYEQVRLIFYINS